MKVSGKADSSASDLPGNSAVKELITRKAAEHDKDGNSENALRIAAKSSQQAEKFGAGELRKLAREQSVDRIDVSLASSIATELSPEAFLSERKARVEQIKLAVQSGTYFRSSEEIAGKLAEEITLEILGSKSAGNE